MNRDVMLLAAQSRLLIDQKVLLGCCYLAQ